MFDFLSTEFFREDSMRETVILFALLLSSISAAAQAPKAATYITDAQVKAVNALPGVDRQIVSVDIGKLNEAVGVIHRGPTGAAATAAANPIAPDQACGQQAAAAPAGANPGGISHDHQTETYIILSGSGTLVTGGHIVNGRKSAADSEVTKVLNGPSCSGLIAGADVVKRIVHPGDIIIIPATVPHGWTDIADHVDYLSVRPDPDRVLPAGYTNPVLKK
jgi:mannose-6-phosphate isomerase-like protein (cupin superfamily)